jgi:hypothetical protein
MSTVCGLLALIFIAVVGWFGFSHAPWWVPLITALIAIPLYLGVRPGALPVLMRGGAVSAAATLYIPQVITSAIIFGVGWAIGWAAR